MIFKAHALLLYLLGLYFRWPWYASVAVLFPLGVVLLIYQWRNWRQTYVPGFFSFIFLLGAYYHIFAQERIILHINSWLGSMSMPSSDNLAVPVLEPLFDALVGPLQYRSIFEEMLGVFFVCYLISLAVISIAEYRKTGIILGDFSVRGLVGSSNYKRPQRSTTNELGSGDLASTEQIARWTKPSGKPADTALHVSDLRGSDGVSFKQAKLIVPRQERNRHVLMIAKTGGGKTTRLIIPVLYDDCLDSECSTIVIDSKPEMWAKLAGLTRKYNPDKNILLFNPLDTARSLSWNILGKIEDDTDAKLIANTIIMATDQPQAKSDSPFFRNNALAILNSVMVGLLHDKSDTLSMPRIHELVQSGMRPLCDWLEAHPHALRNTRTFVELARSGSQNADTIMSELSMRLSAWDLPDIRATTSQNELDVEDIIRKPTLFIVELRESEVEMLRPMANVIVVELLRFLTKFAERCPGCQLPRPVGLVIDEFASALGRLPDIHVKLNTLRSRNVSIVAAIQSISQIKANYGENADSVLAGFNTKVFMPPLDIQDAEWASKETGQMTIRFKTNTAGSNKKLVEWFASQNIGTQEQVQQRAVLTPDEIGRPKDNFSTFFMPSTPAFQGNIVPFFLIPEMERRIKASEKNPLSIRAAPIKFEDVMPTAAGAAASGTGGAVGANGLPPGISDTRGWSQEQIDTKLVEVKKTLDWENTTGSARKWWEAFENENKHRTALVLRLAEELANRKATITEFFLAYVYSNTDNIQANLCYLDYTRLKKEEEKRKKEAAAQARDGGTDSGPAAYN